MNASSPWENLQYVCERIKPPPYRKSLDPSSEKSSFTEKNDFVASTKSVLL